MSSPVTAYGGKHARVGSSLLLRQEVIACPISLLYGQQMTPRKQPERSADATRRILAATLELVGEWGLEGFSLEDVGVRAGVSRALPRYYFKTRAQLVEAAVAGLLKPRDTPAGGGLEDLLESLARSLGRLRSVRVRALLAVLSEPASQASRSAAIRTYFEGGERLLEAHLRAGVEAGSIKSSVDPVDVARLLAAAVFGEAIAAGSNPADVTDGRAQAFLSTVRQMLAVEPSAPSASSAPVKKGARRKTPTLPAADQPDLFGSSEVIDPLL